MSFHIPPEELDNKVRVHADEVFRADIDELQAIVRMRHEEPSPSNSR